MGKWRRMRRRASTVRRTPPRRAAFGDDAIAEAVRLTLEETPPDATHWSLHCSMSGHAALDHSSHLPSVQPHRSETFKLSSDPFLWRRPRSSVCTTVSTKRARSALDRSQPLLPMRPGQASHDQYRDHDDRARVPIPRPRRGERPCLDIHIVMDNYGTHKTKAMTGSPNGRAGRPISHPRCSPPGYDVVGVGLLFQ